MDAADQAPLRVSGASEGRAWRGLIVLCILIGAMGLFIWNGASLFIDLSRGIPEVTDDLTMAATALALNVALILFGWRYYVDLQHETMRREESEARALKQASTDGMTGLLNRKGFSEAAMKLAAEAKDGETEIAVISLQLNRFKMVNERHGFDAGDELLRRIAKAIEDTTGGRPVARVAGDEFAVIMVQRPGRRDTIDAFAKRLLELAGRPYEIDDKVIQVGAHVGIASAEIGEMKARDLLRRADIALAAGKAGRLARAVWFDEGMERELLAHSEIEQGIRYGIEAGQFIPYFEPQVDLTTGKVLGFEVLSRWDHPLAGMVGPSRFIPVAEEHNLIEALSEVVFKQAMKAALEWPDHVDLSINVAPSQLADSWLAQKLVRMLTETGFPAERLVVEITENSLFADLDLARSIVSSLKNQGIRIALDDFGTGYSSLSHLRALPFDVIKIDRSFVSSLSRDRESRAIVRAVSTLAEALDIPVTVEGVETAKTHAAVLEMGCRFGQGWYFGKAMSADQAEQLLRQPISLDESDRDTDDDVAANG
ncbi:putative bifunctional diguanylate cyclase/phosphodiesterase [Sphingomicrobium sediminis]|uniref:Bifunctional diguanylate cyclase/phosphodiesterase n=1 Tax=Sphingomicrobium sediminis TaxID=2950949 RepID=A0A9X2EG27_9SPHN|nr:bifunctional diguanylate cyclase/phosphodiesterase [Sphingomicrobium sediminis]MCM8557353.1 bifunctional diguanylate cyclase/phosphodiesterase [Sphingomicrobium sediminis]